MKKLCYNCNEGFDNMRKIDVHTHLIENICGVGSKGELRPLGNGKAQYANGDVINLFPSEYGDKSVDDETLIRVLKSHNVEKTVCLQGNYAGFQNLYTYESMQRHPNFILAAATYDPFSYNKKLIIKHLFDDLKIKVIKMEVSNGSGLMANHQTVDLNGDIMNEVYTMANDHKLIFVIDIGRPNNNCYQVDNLANAIKKYPNMKFVICHLTAPQHNQLDILKENLNKLNLINVYFDIASLPNNTKQPYPFIEAQNYIRTAIDIVGINKIMWGSDFPMAMNYSTYEQSYKYIEDSDLFTQEEKQKIFYDNALEVFFND